ncbi:hypothetical protein [Modestobacter excelsi]|nr:hypothetical protein [Modestobacter excelsi]
MEFATLAGFRRPAEEHHRSHVPCIVAPEQGCARDDAAARAGGLAVQVPG